MDSWLNDLLVKWHNVFVKNLNIKKDTGTRTEEEMV